MAEYVDKKHIYDLFEGTNGVIRLHVAEVDTLPAADAAPVVHGRWLINSDGYYPYCSECKNEPKGGHMTDYCPNCGADMRVGKAEKLESHSKEDGE